MKELIITYHIDSPHKLCNGGMGEVRFETPKRMKSIEDKPATDRQASPKRNVLKQVGL